MQSKYVLAVMVMVCLSASFCGAVTSKITRYNSSREFQKGETNDVIIGSRGTIQLGRRAEILVKQFDDVWSINSIVSIGDTVYVGTSPNGGVYSFVASGLKKIYAAKLTKKERPRDSNDREVNEPNDPNAVKQDKHFANEHIFAMAADASGHLLVGISGQRCALCRLEGGELKTIYEPNDANYIFAISTDKGGDIYLGTGPKGKIYRIDSSGKRGEVLYCSPDKNILSLAQGPDGQIYAGSDSRGIIYRINPKTKDAVILYDSEQQEITALVFIGEELYATATSANAVGAETKFAAQ
jgi:outer membrane protein assembly factor BamB